MFLLSGYNINYHRFIWFIYTFFRINCHWDNHMTSLIASEVTLKQMYEITQN